MSRLSPFRFPRGAVALGMALSAAPLAGQGGPPLGAQSLQDLSFGQVVAGLESWVSPSDPTGAGVFRIRGRQGASVEIRFLLPPALVGPGGATLPLLFGAGDGRLSPTQNPGDGFALDPTIPVAVSLPGQPWNHLFLGGMVLPPGSATPGAYSAPVVLIVSDLGSQ